MRIKAIAKHIEAQLLKTTVASSIYEYVQALHVLSTVPSTLLDDNDKAVIESTPRREEDYLFIEPTVPANQVELDRMAAVANANKPVLPKRNSTKVTVTTNNTQTGETVVTEHETTAEIDTFSDVDKPTYTPKDIAIIELIAARVERRVTETLLLKNVAKALAISPPKVTQVVREHLSDKYDLIRGKDLLPNTMYTGKEPHSKKGYYIVPIRHRKK